MKKTLATALLMLAASPVFAANTDITVVPVPGGAFVTVTQDGQPLEGTEVVTKPEIFGAKVTDDQGRAFFSASPQITQRVEFSVTDTDGHKVSQTRTIERRE
ncbi:hypothetical protein GCE9029_03172 [Grimontia celer]|uniref:Nickel uptake substrate-specific transmembrane region n=1 Tax=Grimontia celer TaxID=1796497 RepID=A0A128F6C9_9GAMM|nr:hypothetical protein [Grimontia celer]CZF82349.1 hypothetical protein GCE9029_03172 [Grimontia celer]